MAALFLKAERIINGCGQVFEDSYVAIDDGKILKISSNSDIPDGAIVVDYKSKTVIPGLINAHVHITHAGTADPNSTVRDFTDVDTFMLCLNNLESYMKTGVTYVRSMGASSFWDVKFRDALKKSGKQYVGIVASGPAICMTGGHGWKNGIEANGADACRKAVREVLKGGADVVKFMATGGVMTKGVEPGSPQLDYEEMSVICAEAAKADRKTATHAQGSQGIYDAVRAGVTSIEHGFYLTDETMEMMLKQGTWLVPTLAAPYHIVKNGVENGVSAYAVEKAKRCIEAHVESFKKAMKAGINIAAGTDAGTPFNIHTASWLELMLMVQYGMNPMDAIITGTKKSAELLGIIDGYGTLEPGKMADIAVIDGNPLENIGCLEKVCAVYKHGICQI